MQDIKKKIISGGRWALLGRIAIAGMGVIVNGLLARLLSPEELGAYFISLAIAVTVAAIAPIGMNHAVVRLVSEGIVNNDTFKIRNSIILSLLVTLFISVIVGLAFVFGLGEWIASTVFSSSYLSSVVFLLAVWIVIRSLQDVLVECFRGYHAIGKSLMFGGIVTTLFMLLILSWFKATKENFTLIDVVNFTVFASLLSLAIGFIYLYKDIFSSGQTSSSADKKNMLGENLTLSLPMWGSAILFIALSQLDMWVLGMFRSEEEVALYGAAFKLVMLVGMPLLMVNSVVPPIISELNATKKYTLLQKSLRYTASLAALPSIAATLLYVFFGDYLLQLVYGDFYSRSYLILAILCVGQLGIVWVGACTCALNMAGYQKELLVIVGVSLLLSAILIVPAAIHFGAIGVAVITVLWQLILHLSALFMAKKKVGIWTHVDFNAIRLSVVFNTLKQLGVFKSNNST